MDLNLFFVFPVDEVFLLKSDYSFKVKLTTLNN